MSINEIHRGRRIFQLCDSLMHGKKTRASLYTSPSLADRSLATVSSVLSSLLVVCDDKEGMEKHTKLKKYTNYQTQS